MQCTIKLQLRETPKKEDTDMKKILSLIAAIVLTISMAACSESSSTADTSGNSSSSASDSSEQGKDKNAPPDKPDGSRPDAPPDGKGGDKPDGKPGGTQSEVVYDAATEITKSQRDDNKTYESSDADKIALMISSSDEDTITDPTVKKSGDSDGGDNCNFYDRMQLCLSRAARPRPSRVER